MFLLRRTAATLALLTAATWPTGAGATENPDAAWAVLSAARDALLDERREMDFEQVFVPSGFTTGETERGRVSLDLPAHLRWDYDTPFPRTYLVVDDTVYTWNEGEPAGRRFSLGSDEARHLELLRLDVERLRARYEARVVERLESVVRVALSPVEDDPRIVEAFLDVEAESGRLLRIAYRDADGNETRYSLSEERACDDLGRFAPPDGLDWIDS